MTLNDYKLSLMYHLQSRFLNFYGYYTPITGEALTQVSGDTYSFENKNLQFADASGNLCQTVTIYDGGIPLAASGAFAVNYIDSQVTLTASASGSVTADYFYSPMTVLDAFPDKETFEMYDLPIMAVGIMRQRGVPFAIGRGASTWSTAYNIDIFAANDPMRMDMVSQLSVFLSKEPFRIVDFSYGPIINFDGSLNMTFDINAHTTRSIYLPEPSTDFINFGHISDKEKYRALLTGIIKDIY